MTILKGKTAVVTGSTSGIGLACARAEGLMTVQISQRGKEYLETARALLRAAQTMTDRAIAGQLKVLAEDYERRAEKASLADANQAFARSEATVERK